MSNGPKYKVDDRVQVELGLRLVEGTVAFIYHNPYYQEHEYIIVQDDWHQTPVTLERYVKKI